MLAYTWNDILTMFAYFAGFLLLLALGTVVVVGGVSSVVIKKTTKLNWATCCLLGLALGVGACKMAFTSPPPKAPTSIKIVEGRSEHPVFAVGVERRFECIGVTKAGNERAVRATWTSSGPGLEIDSNGVAQALKPGSYTVTAEFDGMKAILPAAVSEQKVVTLRLVPEDTTIKVGSFVTYKVFAQWSDGKESDVSLVVNYRSSAEARLSVKNSRTHAFASKPGEFLVTVDYLGASAVGAVRVKPYKN